MFTKEKLEALRAKHPASVVALMFLAPPLVIEERELADALALLDRLLGRYFPNS